MSFNWLRTWRLGIKSLLLHPLRSALTVLAIGIGVLGVVSLLAIGEGISEAAQKQIVGLGADNIIVRSLKPPSEATEGAEGLRPYGITRRDFERMVETIPTIKRALPIREVPRQVFKYADRQIDGRLVGCTPEYAEVTQLFVDRGHFLTDAEILDKQNHCVLSQEVAQRLFLFEDPVGRSIHVEGDYYVVVGVMKSRAPSAGIGGSLTAQDFSNDVYIPITTLRNRIGDFVISRRSGSFEGEIVELNQVTLRIDHVDNVIETAKLVQATLDLYHPDKDVGVTVPLELLKQRETYRLMFILFMGAIATIALTVAGIGIMNIMLATVTERTREIGVRRALGAKKGDITRQFLVETIALCTVGGVTGVLSGLGFPAAFAWGRRRLIDAFPERMSQLPDEILDIDPIIVGWSVPFSFAVAVTIGIVFGLYPAIRAANMDPIEALRHE